MGMCTQSTQRSQRYKCFEAFDWLIGHLEALLSADKADQWALSDFLLRLVFTLRFSKDL